MSVPGVRPLSTGMRVTLVISGGLTFIAGLQLFVGSSRTDRYFAWTIKTPLTAAFFGAAYWAALVLVLMAARERDWANARVSVIAALNVVPLIMIVTFVHFSRFHVHSDSALTLLGTWAFIATYVWLSVVLVFFFVRELRLPGGDPPRRAPLPRWGQVVLAAQAAPLLLGGAVLLCAPSATAGIWPWTLTPITGRVAGAWLWAIGAAAAIGVWERDWRRLRAPLAAYVVLAVLAGVAFARYPGTVDWDHPSAAGLVVLLASMLALGVVGLRAGIEAERPASAEAATTA